LQKWIVNCVKEFEKLWETSEFQQHELRELIEKHSKEYDLENRVKELEKLLFHNYISGDRKLYERCLDKLIERYEDKYVIGEDN